jgi:DNA polymerase (family 10)
MKNAIIAEIFERIADILEFKGELVFKIAAYRKAARIIQNLTEDIENIYKTGRLREIPGVGEGIAKKIKEYFTTGKISKYEELKNTVPEGLIKLMGIPSLGPKTLLLAHKELNVNTLEDLQRVIEDGSLQALRGMGAQKVENIKKGIQRFLMSKDRLLLGKALPLVEEIINELKKRIDVKNILPAGSLRRMKETIGDIDILAATLDNIKLIEEFTRLSCVSKVLASGVTKASILTEDNLQVDLRVVEEESFGSALQYFTGSKAHNIKVRELAKSYGLKINEYGVFKQDKKIAGRDEESVYKAIGLCWIPPELREDTGEVEAAKNNKLPLLVNNKDIKGDLHIHSNYSDGTMTIEEIAEKAKAMGYKFVAICDHSQSVKYAGGLSEKELLAQIEKIKRLNQSLDGIYILAGSEVDIKQDGSLDYPDSILKELDIVIAAVHMGFKQNVTERMIKAMNNYYVNVLAHPTGRLLTGREGYEVDMLRVIEEAKKTNTTLEINAYYERLDLGNGYLKHAKDLGIKFSIGTDAHHIDQLWMMDLGVGIARRGWLTKEDIINTYDTKELLRFLSSKKR